MLDIARSVWRALIPASIRSSRLITDLKTRLLPHNWIYDESYYLTEVDGAAMLSAPAMAETLMQIWAPARVVDVGCGTGALAAEMTSRGVSVEGLEYADAAIAICRDRGISVRKFDIETQDPLDLVADLVVSFEVAEHLPEKVADRYVALMCAMADHVVISAAPPGQGGTDHVNEQPPEYWIGKFAAYGLVFDEERTAAIREAFRASGSVVIFYIENTLAFSANQAPAR